MMEFSSPRKTHRVPDDARRHFTGQVPRILIDLCSQSATNRRAIAELTYLDEMEHLFRNVPHPSVRDLLRYRFDNDEESGLEGLALGGGDYFTPWHFPDYAG